MVDAFLFPTNNYPFYSLQISFISVFSSLVIKKWNMFLHEQSLSLSLFLSFSIYPIYTRTEKNQKLSHAHLEGKIFASHEPLKMNVTEEAVCSRKA